jgi:hypothetical protein
MLAASINATRPNILKLLKAVLGKARLIVVPSINAKVICKVNSVVILAIIILV